MSFIKITTEDDMNYSPYFGSVNDYSRYGRNSRKGKKSQREKIKHMLSELNKDYQDSLEAQKMLRRSRAKRRSEEKGESFIKCKK